MEEIEISNCLFQFVVGASTACQVCDCELPKIESSTASLSTNQIDKVCDLVPSTLRGHSRVRGDLIRIVSFEIQILTGFAEIELLDFDPIMN